MVADTYLVLDFLPALHGLLHKHLRSGREGLVAQVAQFAVVGSKTGAKTTQGKGTAHNHGVANLTAGVTLVTLKDT